MTNPERPTGSEERSSGVVHGESVNQLSAGGEERPSFEHRERQGRVVGGDVQLQGGVDADQQLDRLDGESLQPHRVDQRLDGLNHLETGDMTSITV